MLNKLRYSLQYYTTIKRMKQLSGYCYRIISMVYYQVKNLRNSVHGVLPFVCVCIFKNIFFICLRVWNTSEKIHNKSIASVEGIDG